jgi:predicted XRE-type DNA-binding protein
MTVAEQVSSVWDAIEDTSAEAEHMRLRSTLMKALQEHIRTSGLTQAQTARLLNTTQPRISDLMRNRIDLFGLDTLVTMLATAGLHVEVTIRKAA